MPKALILVVVAEDSSERELRTRVGMTFSDYDLNVPTLEKANSHDPDADVSWPFWTWFLPNPLP